MNNYLHYVFNQFNSKNNFEFHGILSIYLSFFLFNPHVDGEFKKYLNSNISHLSTLDKMSLFFSLNLTSSAFFHIENGVWDMTRNCKVEMLMLSIHLTSTTHHSK